VVVVLTFACWPAAAQATFPGANGKIAFAHSVSGTLQIYTINPDGSGLTPLTSSAGWNVSPAWSPDGGKIAFSSSRDDPNPGGCNPCNFEIYVMNADGSGQTRLTTDASNDRNPQWSPDGAKIVFDSTRTADGDIYSMNPNGTGLVRLTTTAGPDKDPAWAPDGKKIAFSDPELVLTNPDGTNRTPVTNDQSYEQLAPDWSPDGTRIAFQQPDCLLYDSDCASQDNRQRVLTIGLDGTGQSDLDHPSTSPAWSPDGSRIVVSHETCADHGFFIICDPSDLVTMNPDGSGRTNLTTISGATGAYPSWQPIPQTYARPRGATPMYASLVPAYKQCTSPDTTHGAPLSYPSCRQPTFSQPERTMSQESPNLTLGTPDNSGAAANFVGSVRLDVHPGNPATPADVGIRASMTDIRCNVSVQAAACGSPNCCDGPDYVGELQGRLALRITDRDNAPSPGGSGPGTMTDTPFAFTVPCSVTSSTSEGGVCSAATSADALVPGIVKEGVRAIWELGQVQVWDGGADGDVDTAADNSLFLTQGVYVF
jgi:Tol biopolymer transport system component